MGAEASSLPPKSDLPYPDAWGKKLTGDATAAKGALVAISELDIAALLAVKPPLPELAPDAWNFQDFMGCAQEALNVDIRLQKRIDQVVPKRVLEEEFWRLYYCHAYNILTGAGGSHQSTSSTPSGLLPIDMALLKASDDSTSNAIISVFKDDTTFRILSQKETDGILKRDAEDDEKLATGIAKAVAKGVVEKNPPVETTCQINVLGKSADVVASEILGHLGDAPKTGCVLVLQGLSGTGKGTTVAKLQASLPRAACWSNGNVFRALTLLACAHCEKLGIQLSSEVLTAPLLEALMSCLKFGKFNGEFDINVKGHGYDVLVSEVANTMLKEPRVSKNIPTIAEVTQGEVIKFAAAAAETMRSDGMNVLMEGRAQTLDYIRTPHRFELTLSEPIIIGMRRAAQRMMGSAVTCLKDNSASTAEVHVALEESLARMLGPIASS